MSCLGLVTHSNGSREVVVTSGYYSSTGPATEILNLDTMTWRDGPQFPEYQTYWATSLPYGNSFLAIGGVSIGYGRRNEIWHFNPDSYTWDIVSAMTQERELLAAIALPDIVCDQL